ncbi:transglutaminase family protein [Streptomyces sp. MT29]|nr:transglutaminase family protein [Streptomyces sp. MT29]
MELIQQHPDIAAYLAPDEAIDHEHPVVREAVAALTHEGGDAYTYARTAFEYVRDTIPHSADSGDPSVTWRASDVLATRNGICYAKSIALTALLRARAIPAGLCYQRLTDDDGTNPGVHGLVALRLPGHDRWARVDPRGNKAGVDAQFSLGSERLAWAVREEIGEVDYPALHATPPTEVLHALRNARDRAELWRNLPTQL